MVRQDCLGFLFVRHSAASSPLRNLSYNSLVLAAFHCEAPKVWLK